MSAIVTYWKAYGGLASLLSSGYLWAAVLLSILLNPLWLIPTEPEATVLWTGLAISVLPGLTAFSLGAIAIFLALTKGAFLAVMQEGGDQSFFLKVVAAFFHFLLVQFAALTLSFCVVAWPNGWLSFIGFTVFLYAVFSGVAAAAILVDVAEIKNVADPLDE
ncbi:hypothetical protein [Aliiroseovarius sediminis]|uniref:hypothetical protein n=1 Tax=Aliiroseovarius sediminis TaxID=2925839 RepID=UPI001F5854A9|nr:hypothetical protein [Aliiroseovarius sediminis]MCI2395337.1 hypothetical protein [Aliiroseovarius sediminis]